MWQIFAIFAENKTPRMKRVFLLLLFALTAPFVQAVGQHIALGERVPELRVEKWIAGQQPAAAPLTYIEFYQSQNEASRKSLDRLKALSDKLGAKLRIIVVAREKEEDAARLAGPYVSRRIGVGIDPTGRTFTAFGVNYLPFGVLTDARNRALWLGNTLQLKEEIIEENLK